MGHKIHPVGMRLGITRTWDSRWFEKKHYIDWLHEDAAIRKFFNRWMRSAAISKIEIERRANQARVIVNTAKPGIIIGKRGVGIEDIRKSLEQLTRKTVQVNVMEIKHPELDARLVGQNIVDQLEKRIAFRRAMKQAISRSMKAGARGVKVQVSGRLGGAEIARTERNADGKVPLHTLRADIDYATVEAFTTFGRIGVKVWIYRGEVLPEQPRGEGRTERSERRRERGGRGRRPQDGTPRESVPVEVALPPIAAETALEPAPVEPALEPAPVEPALEPAPVEPALEPAPVEPALEPAPVEAALEPAPVEVPPVAPPDGSAE
jgi:small subunit ribosomal protein S3